MRGLALREDGEFDGEAVRACRCGMLGFVYGGEEAGGVMDAVGVGSYFFTSCLRDCRCS